MTSTLRTYIICTTARSGSNLVCDYLFRTGRLGRPTETFNPQIVVNGAFGKRYEASQPVELSAYIEWAKENFATRNGVLGIKMLWEDLEYLGGSASLSHVLAQAQLFRLTRRRKLAQAVSYYLAVETGQWMASDPARREPDDVPFDYDAINTHLNRLCLQDARWDAELDARGLKATHWYFEDFLRPRRNMLRHSRIRLAWRSRMAPCPLALKNNHRRVRINLWKRSASATGARTNRTLPKERFMRMLSFFCSRIKTALSPMRLQGMQIVPPRLIKAA